jgi:hypothetical protein
MRRGGENEVFIEGYTIPQQPRPLTLSPPPPPSLPDFNPLPPYILSETPQGQYQVQRMR